jgi:hypothetical protein
MRINLRNQREHYFYSKLTENESAQWNHTAGVFKDKRKICSCNGVCWFWWCKTIWCI